MAENDPPELSLEQILATLASLPQTATPVPPPQHSQAPYPYPAQPPSFPPSHHAVSANIPQNHQPAPDPRLSARPSQSARPQSTQPPAKIIDPATITEWKHGLRCVNKLATQNSAFVPEIQKLIAEQARHVKEWESGRERLVAEQAAKREAEQEHLAVLSLPGIGEKITPLRTDEAEEEELREHEKKVYRACRAMVEAQSARLKALGVPFFGMREEFLRSEGETEDDSEGKKKVTKRELVELQRKMLNHLMELYGD